ncbi:Protein of unknown function (DUF1631) [Burkholderiales bacterium JOSHI_001]|nr:Protein of unknown function (DUF1631) [Burkholderiales bacterium JOSHI_001]
MAAAPSLSDFIDDELMRAPFTMDQVVATLADAAHSLRSTAGSGATAELARTLHARRPDVVREAMQSLRDQVRAEMAGTLATAGRRAGLPDDGELALVDEAEVVVDIALARCAEAVKSRAEAELLELGAFTAALAGDLRIARDTNPLRPETWVRALWLGVQQLPLARSQQAGLLQQAALPLAHELRGAYAEASARLRKAGVVPAAYRTIVGPSGPRTGAPADGEADTTPDNLHELHATMPAPLDAPRNQPDALEQALQAIDTDLSGLPTQADPGEHLLPLQAQRATLVASAATPVDQRLIELFTHLFDAMLNAPRLPREGLALLSRLQAPALRIALRDPGMLDTLDHPVWLFIDRVALLTEFSSPAQRERAFVFTNGLVDHLVRGDSPQDAQRFAWGAQRLQAFERHRFEQAVAQASADIAKQRQDQPRPRGAAPDSELPDGAFAQTLPNALDVPMLDTVPASLLPDGVALSGALPQALQESASGDWLWLFLQGQWRVLRLLGRSERHGSWMLLDEREGRTWALRQPAMTQLALAGLALPCQPRSLVRDAALQLQRDQRSAG